MVKSTDLFKEKKGDTFKKWFRHRLQIFVFSGLVIGWWLKLWTAIRTQLKFEVPPLNELVIVGAFAGVILKVTLIYILYLEMNKRRIQCPAH